MISAAEAKKIAEDIENESNRSSILSITDKIEKAAKQGKFSVSIEYQSINDSVRRYLVGLGYNVVKNTSNDPRERYTYYVVSWH